MTMKMNRTFMAVVCFLANTAYAQTAPVVEHYRAKGRFEEVDGDQAVELVTDTIIAALKRLRNERV